MILRWSDHFSQVSASSDDVASWKTTRATRITWEGLLNGRLIRIVSTVRITGGNMAHFLVHSGARIGCHDWNLRGGHYIDLRIVCRDVLTADELRWIGELARTEDDRPVTIRQGKQTLAEAVCIPPLS
jgi:hypothetical protein